MTTADSTLESTDGPLSTRQHDGVGAATASLPLTVRRIASDMLFDGADRLIVEHGDQEYLLRVTSKGRLILTK